MALGEPQGTGALHRGLLPWSGVTSDESLALLLFSAGAEAAARVPVLNFSTFRSTDPPPSTTTHLFEDSSWDKHGRTLLVTCTELQGSQNEVFKESIVGVKAIQHLGFLSYGFHPCYFCCLLKIIKYLFPPAGNTPTASQSE